jgi:hypothetical protein
VTIRWVLLGLQTVTIEDLGIDHTPRDQRTRFQRLNHGFKK